MSNVTDAVSGEAPMSPTSGRPASKPGSAGEFGPECEPQSPYDLITPQGNGRRTVFAIVALVALCAAGWFGKPLVQPAFEGLGAGGSTVAFHPEWVALTAETDFGAAAWPGMTLRSVRVEGCVVAELGELDEPPAEEGADVTFNETPRSRAYCEFQPSGAWLVHGEWSDDAAQPVLGLVGGPEASVTLVEGLQERALDRRQALPQTVESGESALLVLLWEFGPELTNPLDHPTCEPGQVGAWTCDVWGLDEAPELVLELELRSALGVTRIQRINVTGEPV
jgi:hypothetical protein